MAESSPHQAPALPRTRVISTEPRLPTALPAEPRWLLEVVTVAKVAVTVAKVAVTAAKVLQHKLPTLADTVGREQPVTHRTKVQANSVVRRVTRTTPSRVVPAVTMRAVPAPQTQPVDTEQAAVQHPQGIRDLPMMETLPTPALTTRVLGLAPRVVTQRDPEAVTHPPERRADTRQALAAIPIRRALTAAAVERQEQQRRQHLANLRRTTAVTRPRRAVQQLVIQLARPVATPRRVPTHPARRAARPEPRSIREPRQARQVDTRHPTALPELAATARRVTAPRLRLPPRATLPRARVAERDSHPTVARRPTALNMVSKSNQL